MNPAMNIHGCMCSLRLFCFFFCFKANHYRLVVHNVISFFFWFKRGGFFVGNTSSLDCCSAHFRQCKQDIVPSRQCQRWNLLLWKSEKLLKIGTNCWKGQRPELRSKLVFKKDEVSSLSWSCTCCFGSALQWWIWADDPRPHDLGTKKSMALS